MIKRVAFRVDSSTVIGVGHVARCLTLANAFRKKGATILFICRDLAGNSIKQIVDNNFDIKILPFNETDIVLSVDPNEYSSWIEGTLEEDIAQSETLLSLYEPDLLVVDHYALDSAWESRVSHLCKKILVIDDLANRHHVCDFLVDQNLGRAVSHYQNLVPSKCKVLAGSKYAMLRNEFIQFRDYSVTRRRSPELKSILISMGGIDRLNTTRDVLCGLNDSKLASEIRLTIIMGDSAPHINNIIAIASEMRFRIEVLRNVNNMGKLLSECDLAIGAGGSSTWERCCLGIPSIVVVTADNQRTLAEQVSRSGSAKVILSRDSLAARIAEVVNELSIPIDLKNMSECALDVTNGRGVDLVVGELFFEC